MLSTSQYSTVKLTGSALLSISIAGCSSAPALVIAGSYFPAWLICCVIGVAVALGARVVLMLTPYNNKLPMQLLVCGAIGAIFAALIWIIWKGV